MSLLLFPCRETFARQLFFLFSPLSENRFKRPFFFLLCAPRGEGSGGPLPPEPLKQADCFFPPLPFLLPLFFPVERSISLLL